MTDQKVEGRTGTHRVGEEELSLERCIQVGQTRKGCYEVFTRETLQRHYCGSKILLIKNQIGEVSDTVEHFFSGSE